MEILDADGLPVSYVWFKLEVSAPSRSNHSETKLETPTAAYSGIPIPPSLFERPFHVLPPINLATVYSEFFDDPDFSDYRVVVGGQTFNVSKVILAKHSPVFKRAISSNMKEGLTSEYKIEDLEVDVIKIMLQFMYGKDIKNEDLVVAEDVIRAAHRFEVENLVVSFLSFRD
jgi:hypothetical protein